MFIHNEQGVNVTSFTTPFYRYHILVYAETLFFIDLLNNVDKVMYYEYGHTTPE
jgi:hypothetical protein